MQKSQSKIQPKFGTGSEFVTHRASYENTEDQAIYQLASISKSYTGVLANYMALEGKFGHSGLGANLVELFESCGTTEATQIANILRNKGFEKATIATILNHTSGIGIINYKSIATNIERSEKIIKGQRAMSDVEFLEKELPEKGKHWKEPFGYANEGFFLFQKLVDNLPSSKVFEKEMEERILTPLGLINTGFSGDEKIASKEQRAYNYIPDGETLVSLGAKNTTGQLQKTEANKLLPTGTAIKAAGGLSASMSDLVKFANKIPELYSEPQIAKQLYNASFNQGLCEDENGKDIPNTVLLYSCGIYIRIASLQNDKIKVDFRHGGQLFGGFQTKMNASCEYDFRGTPEEFIEAMKNGTKLTPSLLTDETKAEYEKYDGLAQEMLLDSIVGDYHTKLLYDIGSKAVQDSEIRQEQFDEVCKNAKLVSKSGERYAMNMGLSNLGVNTCHLWSKCGELGKNIKTEIFNKFATQEGVLDSDRLLEIAKNPKEFQALKNELMPNSKIQATEIVTIKQPDLKSMHDSKHSIEEDKGAKGQSGTSSKIIVEIPAGGFYVHDTTNPNIIPYSDGAFGCCYLTIEDPTSKKTLIAHINAQTVMFEPIADKTVQNMLTEFKKQSGDISRLKVTIVHSDKFADYEKAQAEKTESFKLTNSYKEKTEDNMVMEPFANEFLEKALNRSGVNDITINDRLNSNLAEFVTNPMVGTKKTDICFVDNKIHLQNYHSNQCPSQEEWQKPEKERNWSLWKSEVKEHTDGSDKAFKKVSLAQKNGTAITISGGDWKTVHNFYLNLKHGIDKDYIKQDGTKFNFSETATEGFKEQMNNPQFVAVNMNDAVKEHLQYNLKKPTISSLLKEGTDVLSRISSTFKNNQGEINIVANRKQDKSFVEALKERREQEAQGSKGQCK